MSGNTVINVFGEPIEIIVTSRSTNYTCCVGIQTCPPGGGPPPHKHEREEETFMVLEGSFEFFEDGRWTALQPGEIKCSLRGQYHAFRNAGSKPGRMMFIINAGGLDEYFEAISSLTMPDDFVRLTEISRHYGYVFMPPPADDDSAERMSSAPSDPH